MDILNMLRENYEGRQMERIFKNYLILSLIIKDLLFYLILAPVDQQDLDCRKNDIGIFKEMAVECQEESIDVFPTLQLVFDLVNADSEIISAVQEPYQ